MANIDGTNGFKLNGVAANDETGFSVASAGDVNGDGFADLIVGAVWADPNGENSGASYVVFGKASGFAASIDLSSLDGTNGFKLSGVAAYDLSGLSAEGHAVFVAPCAMRADGSNSMPHIDLVEARLTRQKMGASDSTWNGE